MLTPLAVAAEAAPPTPAPAVDFGWHTIGPGEGGWMHGVAISPHDPNTIIAGLDMGSAYATRDGGKSWTTLGQSGTIPLGQPGYRGFYCTAFDPNTPKNVWIGSTHGVFKSEDGGRIWAAKLGGEPDWSFGAIAVDPSDSNVVYAGIGANADGGPGWLHGQVWKTTDGGKTWHEAARPGGKLEDDPGKARSWHTILIDPLSPVLPGRGHARVYVVGAGGLFVSADAGASWASLEDGMPGGKVNLKPDDPSHPISAACDLALAPPPTTARRRYSSLLATFRPRYGDASRTRVRGGVYRSDDGGRTWQEQNAGLRDDLKGVVDRGEGNFLLLSACASSPRNVYLATFRNVFGSRDGGAHWKRLTEAGGDWTAVPDFNGKPEFWALPRFNADGGGGEAYGIASLAVAPTDADEVAYTDSGGVRMTRDGGRTWASAMNDFGAAVYPNLFGNRPPMRATHLQRGRGEQLIVARNLAVDPFDAKTVAIAYDDLGPEITRDGGVWWEWAWMGILNGERADADAVAYDPRQPGRLFLGCDDRPGPTRHVYESNDGGRSFHAIGLPALAEAADKGKATATDVLLVDPREPATRTTLYAGTSVGLFQTQDGGATWRDISGPMVGRSVHRLVQVRSHLDRLYAGLRDPNDSTKGGLFRSDDAGASWRQLGTSQLGDVQSLSVCAARPNVVIVAAGPPDGAGGSVWERITLWRSEDGGDTWKQMDTRRVAFAAVSPVDPDTVYLCTWAKDIAHEVSGLWVSRDGGKTWRDGNKNLSLALAGPQDQMVFDPHDPRHLFLIQDSGVYEGRDSGVARP